MSALRSAHDQPPSRRQLWIAGARLRTLPAAIVPVAVGTAIAWADADNVASGLDRIIWWRAIVALIVALALQIATNYANDYSDGVRGTDDDRAGPLRLVGSGLVDPRRVKYAAFAWFGAAALAGLSLVLAVGPELLIVGAASLLAGWFYTGGSSPYGYLGLGEVFVFVFFGLVATIGSVYIQPAEVSANTIALAIAVGALATALLVTNNLRDIPGDTASGKRTLAVRLGDTATRRLFSGLLVVPFASLAVVGASHPGAFAGWGAIPLALWALRPVSAGALGRDLIPVLERTGRTQLVFGVLVSIGLVLS